MPVTRRTHIVRVTPKGNPNIYVDFEVLDAIAFRRKNGEEMILSVEASKVVPYIKDDTGDNNAKTPSAKVATRRSHMKRVTSSSDGTQFLDVEVLDVVAFRDHRGEQWILNNPDDKSKVYNTTTASGGSAHTATRRVHNEKVYSDPTDTSSPYMLVQRVDMMSFRNVRGEELIVEMPSSDDGSGNGRATTHMTPPDYNPGDSGVVPPANSDPEIYCYIPPDSAGVTTGTDNDNDTVVACGPMWWPRGINKKSGPWYWYIPVQTTSTYSITHTKGKFVWAGDPTASSWAGNPATLTLVYAPGFFFVGADGNDQFHAYQPWGWPSLDAAIDGGIDGSDWGLVDFDDTRIDDSAENGLSTNPAVPGVRGDPDIWQVTGIPAPALVPPVPPAKKWFPGPISPALAKKVAQTWLQQWNGTSTLFNGARAALSGMYTLKYEYITWPPFVDHGGTQRFGGSGEPKTVSFPTTLFHVPLYDITVFPPLTGGRYIGGLPIEFWAPIDASGNQGDIENYAMFIGVTQLDPTKWDTSKPQSPVRKKSKP